MRTPLRLHGAWLLPAVALITACSGIPLKERQEAERARYESYAGPPVDQFTWLGRFDSWQPVGTNQLVVWTTPFQAYLIKVAPPCNDLQFAHRVGLTSTASTVSARFDFVKVGHWRCPIQEIRPVDYQRMRQDMRKEAEAAKNGAGT
ncbi:MAG TPA: DUF6491 family protein [Steroidobacteraceae bacterium]|nr:DUF6491 family protein [Steroidobacteraceae bacterium]